MKALRRPEGAVVAMAVVWAGVLSFLSLQRFRGFWTGRFDVGNMVQAVWSTAHGRPLETTDVLGRQFTRLGAHVDPILVLFTPLTWTGHLPEALLVSQAVIVATGAFPAFLLGRRWLGDERLAVAAAAVYLLYPPLLWTTLAEFHPVTLAAPLLLWCIWAAEERRYVTLSVLAGLTLLTKEEVGLALAVLGAWMFVRGTGRRYGPVLAAVSLVWVAVAMKVVIPHFNEGRGTEFTNRYDLGSPWEAAQWVAGYPRVSYLGALLIPLLFLPLLAPLLAAGALPEVLINVLAEYFPQYSIQFQYVAVIVPFVVAASILGLATLRRRAPRRLAPALGRTRAVAAVWVGTVLLSGVYLGPLPWWGAVPVVGSDARTEQYHVGHHAHVMARAAALIPDRVPVSAGNLFGAHLSERERVYTFPVIGDARWIIVDAKRPYLADRLLPAAHAVELAALIARPDMRRVFDEDGVMVFRRVGR